MSEANPKKKSNRETNPKVKVSKAKTVSAASTDEKQTTVSAKGKKGKVRNPSPQKNIGQRKNDKRKGRATAGSGSGLETGTISPNSHPTKGDLFPKHDTPPPIKEKAEDAELVGEANTGILPYVSIVIPVYNEEALLETAIRSLRQQLSESFGWPYELLVAENGSTDATLPIARRMEQKYPEVRVLSTGEPNYGKALKLGILESRGQFIICDEIDLCDIDFYKRALDRLEFGYDLVVGSKLLDGSQDKRPKFRHLASHSYNFLLRILAGFKGSDTHGLKAFHRDKLLGVVADCKVDKDVFASELVIRAERRQIRITEIPLRVVEKRLPSINLVRRVPRVLKDLVRLTIVVRFWD